MHYYQFNIADYRKDTTHLSRLEHSIYRDLIDWCYLEECSIPLDLAIVYRRLRLSSTDDERALNAVLTDFFECTNEGYVQMRIQAEIIAYNKQLDNASKAGKASAEARKHRQHERPFNDRSTTVQPTINQEPITNISTSLRSVDKRAPRFDAQAHLISLGVDSQIADDWITHRKAKKAPITSTVIAGIAREAKAAGRPLSDVLEACCQRGWTGFKAEWIADKQINGKTQRQIDNEATTRAIFGNLLTPIERVISGEVIK